MSNCNENYYIKFVLTAGIKINMERGLSDVSIHFPYGILHMENE